MWASERAEGQNRGPCQQGQFLFAFLNRGAMQDPVPALGENRNRTPQTASAGLLTGPARAPCAVGGCPREEHTLAQRPRRGRTP